MNNKTVSVGTKIPATTAIQLRSVLDHYHRTFSGQLRMWIEQAYNRISK